MFEDVNEVVELRDDVTQYLTFDFGGIDDKNGKSGALVGATHIIFEFEGEESETMGYQKVALDNALDKIYPHLAIPQVSASRETRTLSNGEQKLYEFTVTAQGDDSVYIGEVSFDLTLTGATVSGWRLEADGSEVDLDSNTVRSNVLTIVPTSLEEIRKGTSTRYAVYGTVASSGDNDSVNVRLKRDTATRTDTNTAPRTFATAQTAGAFVWSANALDLSGDTDQEAALDWFDGFALWQTDDVRDWTTEK